MDKYAEKLLYRCGLTDKTIGLDGSPIHFGTALGLRNYKTAYALGYRSILSVSKPAMSAEIEAHFSNRDAADEAFSLFEADMLSGTPGTFIADGWEQRGYITAVSPSNLTPRFLEASLECVLLDGSWRKGRKISLFPSSGNVDDAKQYAYRYPYRYASEFGVRSISVNSAVSVTFRMCIFGYVKNPVIRIADNTYSVNVTVPAGGYLILDARDCTASLVDSEGNSTNVYDACERGSGEGCGEYAWQRIPAGSSSVFWSDEFGFDLTLFEERGAPPFGGAQ